MYRSLRNAREVETMRDRLMAMSVEDTALWGMMSATEMVGHLRGAFEMALARLTVTAPPSPMPGSVMKLLALWMPVRWPHDVPTVSELRRGEPAMVGGEFAQRKAELIALFEEFCGSRLSTRHVMFGEMRPADWMRWGFLHTDHHLRQFGR